MPTKGGKFVECGEPWFSPLEGRTIHPHPTPVPHTSAFHYNDIIMSVMTSQTTSFVIVYSTVYSGTDERKHQSSESLAFVQVKGEFTAQMASNTKNVSIWWRHHMLERINYNWHFHTTHGSGHFRARPSVAFSTYLPWLHAPPCNYQL